MLGWHVPFWQLMPSFGWHISMCVGPVQLEAQLRSEYAPFWNVPQQTSPDGQSAGPSQETVVCEQYVPVHVHWPVASMQLY